MNMVLATNVRSVRERKHWTQQHLADVAGVDLRTVQRVEQGVGPGVETMRALANAFDTSIDALQTDYAALMKQWERSYEELQKTHDIVSVSPVNQVRDLEVVGTCDAFVAQCEADEEDVRRAFAQLQTYLTDLRDLWNDVPAISREDYLKEAFELVRALTDRGIVVCFGTCVRPFGAGKGSVKLRTLFLVAWPRGQEQERVAIPK
jgi:transcriptional regulator with XRE-family HTH domain